VEQSQRPRFWNPSRSRGLKERSDMEDELGPISDGRADDDEDLDEDEYRDDRMVIEAQSTGADDDEEEEEDGLGEGFHEDEMDER